MKEVYNTYIGTYIFPSFTVSTTYKIFAMSKTGVVEHWHQEIIAQMFANSVRYVWPLSQIDPPRGEICRYPFGFFKEIKGKTFNEWNSGVWEELHNDKWVCSWHVDTGQTAKNVTE